MSGWKAWNNEETVVPGLFFCLKTGNLFRHRVPWCIRAGQGMKGKKTAHSGLKAPPYSLYVRKSPDRGSLRLTKSKFLPRCQNPLIRSFYPCGKLVGECLTDWQWKAHDGQQPDKEYVLVAYPEKAVLYDTCKQRLAMRFSNDRKKYTAGK